MQSLSFNLDLERQTWTTDIQASEVTSYQLTPMGDPPCPTPLPSA